MDLQELIAIAAGLIDADCDNPEYVRGVVEFIIDAAGYGLNSDDKHTIEKIIRAEAAKL